MRLTVRNHGWLAGLTAMLGVSAAAADPSAPAAAPPDTSGWKCSQCPFMQGYAADAEAGVMYADGANDSYGRYTGIDHTGPYLEAGASGQWRGDGSFLDYDLQNLGLASREGSIDGGRDGSYELRLSYDGQPTRLYDTGATPFRINGNDLTLPAGWPAAGSTATMTALDRSLDPIDIGFDRRTVALQARVFAGSQWTVFGDVRHEEKVGNDLTSASFLTDAIQLPEPIDYVTNSLEAGAAWSGRHGGLRLSYLGSWFEDDSALTFDNPYLPIVPGSTTGALALPPGNTLQQGIASGNWQLPWWSTVASFTASVGRLSQNQAFIPASTVPGSAAGVPASSLNGDVHLTHFAAGLSARPLSGLSLRGNARYDGRDDATTPLAISYIVTDTFPGGTVVTPRYSEDRTHLDGGADYALVRWLRIGVGGQLDDNHYGPGQVLTSSREQQSWGRATFSPLDSLSLTIKGGDGLRKISTFNDEALPAAENPLMLAYDYAPRDRTFGTFTGSWAATSTLTWTLEGSIAKDDYRSTSLGLTNMHERRVSSAIAWTPMDSLSLYADAGWEYLYMLQNGSAGTSPWAATDAEGFWNLSAGGRWTPQERWTISLDYLLAPGYMDMDTAAGGLQQPFPQNWSKLDSARLDVSYRVTKALQIHLHYTRESFGSNDWALGGVGAATVPNLLALGVQPWRDQVDLVGFTIRYELAPPAPAQ